MTTLSVPEILSEVMESFKTDTPELFGPNGLSRDWTSQTAVLGDRITAHLDHVPVVGQYDPVLGFAGPAQDVTTLLEDLPVTLNQMPCVTVKVGLLTAMSTKKPETFKGAIRDMGFALGKKIVDGAIALAMANVSNQFPIVLPECNLDTFDGPVRAQCNYQKMNGSGRWLLLNTAAASQLSSDDRTRSKLFIGELNGDQGLRRWKDVCGFDWIREYPDLNTGSGGNVIGLAGESRLIGTVIRRPFSPASLARQLGIPEMMSENVKTDETSGLTLAAYGWQEAGTGDAYLTITTLVGYVVGNNGGMPGSLTDNAGLILTSTH